MVVLGVGRGSKLEATMMATCWGIGGRRKLRSGSEKEEKEECS